MLQGKVQSLKSSATSLLSGCATDGDGFAVQHASLRPIEMPAHMIDGYSVIVHLSSAILVEWKQERRTIRTHISPGSVSLHSVGELPAFRLTAEVQVLEISLSPLFVYQTLRDEAPDRLHELKNVYGISDPILHHIGMALLADRKEGYPTGSLCSSSLATALTAYLFRQYSTPASASSRCGLSKRDRERLLDYIHAHLGEDMTLARLASLTSYSPHHFTLLFKQTFGVPPHQFLIQARVEEARRLLAVSTTSMSEIAYRMGFAGQSHFVACFRQLMGVTPGRYRQSHLQKSQPF